MTPTTRILVVDDDPGVRDAYRKILQGQPINTVLQTARAGLFDEPAPRGPFAPQLTVVDHGTAAIEAAAAAKAAGATFSMAFVDIRMPPGPDGLTTALALWQIDPDLQIVIVSAYSDTPWSTMTARLGHTDRLLFLKKPFDPVEAQQLALALSKKRELQAMSLLREHELERRVSERTLELANALAAAKLAGAAKMDFLANMSHEIRTPLTAILGFTELMHDAQLSDNQRVEHLATIDRNGRHLLALVNDILDLSKLEAKQLLLDVGPLNLPSLVGDVVSLMRPRAIEKGLTLSVQYSGPCPETIQSDAMRLRQILLNLVGNAIKFTEQGNVRIAVGVEGAGDAPVACFRITDTGIGMSAGSLQSLFHPFMQADSSTARRFGGTGLGLAISQHLATLMGGKITVRSEQGRGSEFTLTVPTGSLTGVPMLAALGETIAGTTGAQPAASLAQVRLAGRILLAEDGMDNQRLLTNILRRAGAEVCTVCDGQAAIDLARHSLAEGRAFDLILMDMQMPVMDGYTATRELRNGGWTGPIVALTAHAMEGDRERCLDVGCDGYETKPVRANRLVETCQRHLGNRSEP